MEGQGVRDPVVELALVTWREHQVGVDVDVAEPKTVGELGGDVPIARTAHSDVDLGQ